MITNLNCSSLPEGYHFGVIETPGVDEVNGCFCVLRQIVIKNDLSCTAVNGFTGLEAYVHPYSTQQIISRAPSKQELLHVCRALNYFSKHGMGKLLDISANMVFGFFDNYRDEPIYGNEEHFVSNETLKLCVKTVSSFLCNLATEGLVNISPDALMQPYYIKTNSKKRRRQYMPIYQKKARDRCPTKLIRDVPEAVVEMLIDLADAYDPMIRFAIILQAYAGFRESEVMNIRQEKSPLSKYPGVKTQKMGSTVIDMGFDLTREFVMRSDKKSVGLIKRKATDYSAVYPKHLPIVADAYDQHLQLLSKTDCEEDYLPMFIDRYGMAMTSTAYCSRFNHLVYHHLTERLSREQDPRLKAFLTLLWNTRLTPHALRHFFSVQLALDGCDAAQLMTYRGDTNPISALAYLTNKKELTETIAESHSMALNGLERIGYHINDK